MSKLPSEILLAPHNECPIRIHHGQVVSKDPDPGVASMLGRLMSDAIREHRESLMDGTPLAERCELCGYRHGIGQPCIKVRTIAAGVSGDDRPYAPIVGQAAAARSKARQQLKDRIRWAETRLTRQEHGHKMDDRRHRRRAR